MQLRQIIPSITIAGTARTGFTESFSLGSVASIMEDYSPAFRVEVSDPENFPEKPYWRMLAMDLYSDGEWSASNRNLMGLRPLFQFKPVHHMATRMFQPGLGFPDNTWTIYMEGSLSRYLPIPGSFRSVEFVAPEVLSIDLAQNTFRLRQTPSNMFSFKLRNVFPDTAFKDSAVDAWFQYQFTDTNDTEIYPRTTTILNLRPAEISVLEGVVAEIKANQPCDDALGFSTAAIQYLWENHDYSLNPYQSFSLRDPVIAWLDARGSGHCELFATSFVLMARLAGYPARICVGFAGGTWKENQELFVVRNRDAHTWCEIRDPEKGWIRVDPTPPSRDDWAASIDGSNIIFGFEPIFEWFEDLKVQYYRNVIGFGTENQNQLLLKVSQTFERLTHRLFNFNLTGDGLWNISNRDSQPVGSNSSSAEAFRPWGWLILLGAITLLAVLILGFRHGRMDPVSRIRMKARQLIRSDKHPFPNTHPLFRDLLLIAYGPSEAWIQPQKLLKDAKKAKKGLKTRKMRQIQ
jgi:hypothetical protein